MNKEYNKFCKRCLYSTSHPLGLIMDDDGICSGCRIHEEKDKLNWLDRFEKLKKIVKDYRLKSGNNYDCIVPVSGASDSYFVVDVVKNQLGMKPLLVSYNKFWNTKIGIWNLANLRTTFNCDILIQNVNPNSVKKIVRNTLAEFGSIYWHCIAGQTVFPVQVSITHKIPLIIWGAHQGVEQVGMFSHEHEVQMTRRYRKNHDLMGKEADDLVTIFNSINEEDIHQYRYPSDIDLNNIGVIGLYLSNYIRWDPIAQHEQMIKKYNFKTMKFHRTFDSYDFVDCFNYMGIHDLLKLFKHGYSKITDHVCREIRHGRISRKEGASLVRFYEKGEVKGLNLFADWLDTNNESLNWILNSHRNNLHWEEIGYRKWDFKGLSKKFEEKECKVLKSEKIEPVRNDYHLDKEDENYITFGKGYP